MSVPLCNQLLANGVCRCAKNAGHTDATHYCCGDVSKPDASADGFEWWNYSVPPMGTTEALVNVIVNTLHLLATVNPTPNDWKRLARMIEELR